MLRSRKRDGVPALDSNQESLEQVACLKCVLIWIRQPSSQLEHYYFCFIIIRMLVPKYRLELLDDTPSEPTNKVYIEPMATVFKVFKLTFTLKIIQLVTFTVVTAIKKR